VELKLEVKQAYEEQLAYHWREAVECMARLDEGAQRIRDWGYRPPTSDDWRDWRGVTRWCAYEAILNWHIDRLHQIHSTGKPGFCWQCAYEAGEGRPRGWAATKCLSHAWVDYLMDEALRAARRLGAPVDCPNCGRRYRPGIDFETHYAACNASVSAVA